MSSKFSRLDFLRFSAVGASTLILPKTLSAAVAPAKKKNEKENFINLGFIGLGQQSLSLLSGMISAVDQVRVVAGADIYDIKRDRFTKRVNDWYAEKGIKNKFTIYNYPEQLLADPNVDAVVIATPDHWHAAIAIAACKAGKDVYLEKPLTFTVYEGQRLIEAVRANHIVFQTGSMQRSMSVFRHAAEICRSGKLGKIKFIRAWAGDGPKPFDLETSTPPAGLDWERWVGPLPAEWLNKYNHTLNPLINDKGRDECWGAWRWHQGLGGGYTTDWGAHMFDIAQWCLDKDGSGPVEVLPPDFSPYGGLTYRYDNGVDLAHINYGWGQSLQVFGEKGWIKVRRGKFEASDPSFMPAAQQDANTGANSVAGRTFETNVSHYQSWFDGIKNRRDPNTPVEVGHSSCTLCNIGNIGYELNRPLKWNPAIEKFMDDEEANSKLHYEYRAPYKLE